MNSVCAWCKEELTVYPEQQGGTRSQGMCTACREFFFPRKGPPAFRKYLDRLAVPVLLVDDDCRVVIANERACSLLAKTRKDVEGHPSGEAFDCSNAGLPGGCGKTEACPECTVRQTLADTYVTGQCHENIVAALDIDAMRGGGHRRITISTWKAGEVVLLKIDRVLAETRE